MAEGEFDEIARLFRPLTGGAAGAFELLDDAAVVPQRAGYDLVVTKDAIVEGVHFLADDAPDLIARKLLRMNLSDLAAKAAQPFACFLAVAWPPAYGPAEREAFAAGLGEDLQAFGVQLLGGDTVCDAGSLHRQPDRAGLALAGRMVRRATARAHDLIGVSGPIGDGVLGLAALGGEVEDRFGYLTARYRLPTPRLDLRGAAGARPRRRPTSPTACWPTPATSPKRAGSSLILDLDRMPLSGAARRWLAAQPDRVQALLRLATGGDDYELVGAFEGEPPSRIHRDRRGRGRRRGSRCASTARRSRSRTRAGRTSRRN